MQQLLLLVHVLISLLLIILVLLQQGKGAEVGAAFGSGASQTIFGSQGSGSFMLKFTSGVAVLFFVTSLTLGYMASHSHKQKNKVNAQASIPADMIQKTDNISAPQTNQAMPEGTASKG